MIDLEKSRYPALTVDFVMARVDQGRWITDCPNNPRCPGAERVRMNVSFVCGLCNAGPLWVVFPPDLVEIEAELIKRPDAVNRNWRPGETLEGLRHENSEHGVA